MTIIISLILLFIVTSIYYFFKLNAKKELNETVPQIYPKITFASTSQINSPRRLILKILKEKELDKKYGIDVVGKEVPTEQGYQFLLSGEVDIAVLNPTTAANANVSSGNKILIFLTSTKPDAQIYTLPDSKIKNFDDLINKKIGTPEKTTTLYSVMTIVLNKIGYDIEKDFKIITSPMPSLPILLEEKSVDAILLSNSSNPKLISEGKAKILFSFNDYWKSNIDMGLPIVGMGAKKEWLTNHQKEAIAFQKAWQEASKYITEHNEMFDTQEIQSFLEVSNPQEVVLLKEIHTELLSYSWTDKDIKDAEKYLELQKDLGLLPKEVPTDIFVKLE